MIMAGIMRRMNLSLFQGYFHIPSKAINSVNIGIGTMNFMEFRANFLSRTCFQRYYGTTTSLSLRYLNSNLNSSLNSNTNSINNTNYYLINNNNRIKEILFNKEHQMAYNSYLLKSHATLFNGFAIDDWQMAAAKITSTPLSSLISIFPMNGNSTIGIRLRLSHTVSNLKHNTSNDINQLFIGLFYDHRLLKPATAAVSVYGDEVTRVDRMELKKRLYKSYKSRKLSNPSTKSRRRHMQSNR